MLNMADDDRTKWDQIYQERIEKPFPPPDPLLFESVLPVPLDEDRRALDLAGGVGQNGIWLAEQGYIVDVIDISRVALSRGQQEAHKRKLPNINFIPADLDSYPLQADTYNVVCVVRYLNRDNAFIAKLRAAVKPGGRVIYQTFNMRYLTIKRDFNAAYLLQLGELQGFFSDWKIIHTDDEDHISELVAIKPT